MKVEKVQRQVLLIALIAAPRFAMAAQWCAVDNFGNQQGCFPTLDYCQSVARGIHGSCVVDGHASSPQSASQVGIDGWVALGSALGELLRKDKAATNPPDAPLAHRDSSGSAQSFLTWFRDHACAEGVRLGLPTAASWSKKSKDIQEYLNGLSAKPRERAIAIEQLDGLTKEWMQENLDQAYQYEKSQKSELAATVANDAAFRSEKIFGTPMSEAMALHIELVGSTMRTAAIVGWQNPGATQDRLEQLLAESCQDMMRLKPR